MAPKVLKKGQKQIDQENTDTLRFYQYVIGAVLIIYGINIVYFLPGWPYYLVMAVSSVLYAGCYKFMESISRGGMDLSMDGGMAEHAKDLLLVTAFVQSFSILSNYVWLLWLIVPGRAIHLIWVNILAPWIFAEPPPEIDEKQQKKMERKMKRQQVFR